MQNISLKRKRKGKPLTDLWYHWPKESQLHIVQQIVKLETKLGALSFKKHGSIYYKSNLEYRSVACDSLSTDIMKVNGTAADLDLSTLDQFAIGPLTEARLWSGGRSNMDLDRGPCEILRGTIENAL